MFDGFSSWMQDYDSCIRLSCGGGGGFFLACKDFGRMFNHSVPACIVCVCVCVCIFFGGVAVEISSHTLIPLCMSGLAHSGSASWDDWPNVPWQVACELVSRYVPSLCLHSSIVGPLQLPRVKGVHMFRYNLLPALLAEWPGSLMCHCSNIGVKWTPTLCIKLLKPAKLNNSNTTTCPRCVDIHIFYFSHAQNWK